MLLCCMCHEWRSEADFALRSKRTGQRQSQCRRCHAAYRREHYLRMKATYLENERRRMRARRQRNLALLLENLLTHPCVDCGEADPIVLEFDHRDPSRKRLDVPRLAAKKAWTVVESEIAKCDVRCVNCHRHRTAVQFNWRRARGQTGATQPAARLGTRPPTTLPLLSVLERARVCHDCGRELPYANNKQKYLARTSRRNRATRDLFAAWLAHHLKDHGCVDCGSKDVVVLEFDHSDRSSKVAAVATLARLRS